MSRDLTTHLVVPVANEEDARETAQALDGYEFGDVTVVHVVEKGEGAPDKLSLEQAKEQGTEAISAFQEVIPAADSELTYGGDIVAAIIDTAVALDASAIAFHPRTESRLVEFLSGDLSLKLLTQSDRPVIALPRGGTDQ